MPKITCTKCGKSYLKTAKYWYFRDNGFLKRPCKACHCQNSKRYKQEKGAKPILPRTCRYCGKEFTPLTRFANRRKHCYDPACIIKAHREYDPEKRKATKIWKAKNKDNRPTMKICPMCGKRRMEPQDHFSCRACRLQAYKSSRCDGDYLYQPAMGSEEEAHHEDSI